MHWHLIEPREWNVHDATRFDNDRMRAERVRSSAGVATSVAEVVAWLDDTLDKLIAQHELSAEQLDSSGLGTLVDRERLTQVRTEMAEHGRDICAMLAIRGGRIVHYSAYAEPGCTAPH